MKKILSLIPAMLLVSFSYAQTETDSKAKTDSLSDAISNVIAGIFNTKVKMDIDTTMIKPLQGMANFYVSEEHGIGIMALVAPQSFDKAKEHMDKESKKQDVKIKEKGEFKENGKTILYQTGTMKKDGKKVNIEMYAVQGDAQRTIYITGFYDPSQKDSFGTVVRKAAVSAHLD